MNHVDWQRRLALACIVVASFGCSKKPPVGDVHGKVTLNGQPVVDGTVRFTPLNGLTGTAGAHIVDGKFEALVPVNTHRVEITAAQLPPGGVVSRHDAVVTIPELIPEKYNKKSELTLDVKEGLNEHHFDLSSK